MRRLSQGRSKQTSDTRRCCGCDCSMAVYARVCRCLRRRNTSIRVAPVKDRAALSMILEGERSGKLKPGMTILDATSGNTGIAYAMIGASRGYRVKVCLPKNASLPRKRILRRYGVEIVETDPMLMTDGAQLIAREIFASDPEKYFYPINTTTMPTGWPTTKPLRTRSGNRLTAVSRISWRVWGRPVRSSAW